MRNALLLVLAPALVSMTGPGQARAAEDHPRMCPAARPYVGPARHAPVDIDRARTVGNLHGTLDAATRQRLEAAFDIAFSASRAHAMTVAVGVPGVGAWTQTRGSQLSQFYWASVGKQATAAIVLQLVEEGRLSLSDPISRWAPGTPNGDAITIEMLLEHTSGLFSASEDLRIHRENRPQPLSAELQVLRRHGPLFCPGERWRYSNSGYDLLGAVVESIDQRTLDEAIDARILRPLGLTETTVLSPRSDVSGITPPVSDTADPAIDIRAPGAAGPLAASALDMMRLEQGLLTGHLVRSETLERMLAGPYPMFQVGQFYGLGIMVYDVPDVARRVFWIGHSGGASGVKAFSAYAPAQGAYVAVALTGDGSAEATANLLLKAIAP